MTAARPRRLRGLASRPFLAAALAGALWGCADTAPESVQFARVTVEGESAPLQLEVSTDFEMVLDPESRKVDPVLFSADTIEITAPYAETFELNSRFRFLVRLRNVRPDTVDARMRVEIDGRLKYDQSALLGVGGYLQHVFVLQTTR